MTRLAPRALIATAIAAAALALTGCEYWQYNIANGNDPPESKGQNDVISYVRDYGYRPVAMTLNEVCGHRAYEIQAHLGSYGYNTVFDAIDPGGCGGSGYGNAVVHLGGRVPFPGHPNGILRMRYDGGRRGAQAVAIGAGGMRALVWVTHLESSSDVIAGNQAWQLLGLVQHWKQQTGWLTVVGGDFNLTPAQFPMNYWCGYFSEPMRCSQAYPTHWEEGKIDYLFSNVPWNGGSILHSPNSDHGLQRGLFR